MSQHDGVIDNGTGLAVRTDINAAILALFTNSSGATAPATTYAYQFWVDTSSTAVLKIRDGTNSSWVTVGDITSSLGSLPLSGGTMTGDILLDNDATVGTPDLAFAGDTDTGMYSAGANLLGLVAAGAELLRLDGPNGVVKLLGTNGVYVPIGTTAQRPGGTPTGIIRYNTDLTSFEGYANGAWLTIGNAPMAQSTIKGRAAGAGTGAPTDLSATQATAILDNMVGDSGAGGTKGLVPAPAAGDAAGGKFLKADGTWASPGGGGGSLTTVEYTEDTAFVVPGGVTKLILTSKKRNPSFSTNINVETSSYGPMIIDQEGVVWGVGTNATGNLADGTVTSRSSYVAMVGNLLFKQLTVGDTGIGAVGGLDRDGNLYMWGFNDNGQVGDATVVAKSSPVLVAGPVKKFSKVKSFGQCVAALTSAGKLYMWGYNLDGECGDGTVLAKSSPTAVLGGLFFKDMWGRESSGATIFALTHDGALYSWGLNNNGMCGVGDILPHSSPVAVVGGLTFSKVAVAWTGTTVGALTTSGAAYCWGAGSSGQIGDGTNGATAQKSSPTAVLGGHTFVDIATLNGQNFFGLKADGSLWAWGLNQAGRLGVGDIVNRSSPVAVVGGYVFSKVFPGGSNMYGLTTSGDLYAWGVNDNGQLGDGTVLARSSPTLVVGGYKFKDLYTNGVNGGEMALGLTQDGKLYAWGYNFNGQLGVGDTVARSSPTLVLGSHFCSIDENAETQFMTVVPGNTYNLKFTLANTMFNGVGIGKGRADSVTIGYFV